MELNSDSKLALNMLDLGRKSIQVSDNSKVKENKFIVIDEEEEGEDGSEFNRQSVQRMFHKSRQLLKKAKMTRLSSEDKRSNKDEIISKWRNYVCCLHYALIAKDYFYYCMGWFKNIYRPNNVLKPKKLSMKKMNLRMNILHQNIRSLWRIDWREEKQLISHIHGTRLTQWELKWM